MDIKQPKGKIQFPVSFNLKIISTKYDSENAAYTIFGMVLESSKVKYDNWTNKPSSAGKYASYRVDVIIKDEPTFKRLYSELGKIDGVKCVI